MAIVSDWGKGAAGMEFYGSTKGVDNRNAVYAASDPGFEGRHVDSASRGRK